MAARARRYDRRLLGTWKSDRRRTIHEFVPRKGATPKAVRKFKSLFGKLTVRYGRCRMITEFGNVRTECEYEVLGSDSESVVIRFYDSVWNEDRICQIHFQEEHYWIWALCMREFFKKVVK
jgi:hypothetical protein